MTTSLIEKSFRYLAKTVRLGEPDITENTEVVEITLTLIDNIDDTEDVPSIVPDTCQYPGCEKEPTWAVSEMYLGEEPEHQAWKTSIDWLRLEDAGPEGTR